MYSFIITLYIASPQFSPISARNVKSPSLGGDSLLFTSSPSSTYTSFLKVGISLFLASPPNYPFSHKQEAQRATYHAPEYNVPPFWRIGQGSHLVFPIGRKNTNLVEDVEIFLPVKFRCRPFSGFRGEVENVSANQRPGWPSCFSNRPEKHKLGRWRWDLVSCQVLLNSV